MVKKDDVTLTVSGHITGTCNTHGICSSYVCYKCHYDKIKELENKIRALKYELEDKKTRLLEF